MGVYNCAGTIDEAISSIVTQSYRRWELVVCDDGSLDETPLKLAEWKSRLGERMLLLTNERNLRLAATLNRCLSQARGDLIARMDGDDRSAATRLERQVAYLREHPEIDLVGTAMRRFDERGVADLVPVRANPGPQDLKYGAPFCHATIVARRAVFDSLGGYSTARDSERVEDLELWFRFFERGLRGANLVEPLYLVREDMAAVRRRTLRNRWNVAQTMTRGYRRLRFPLVWYWRPLVELAKGFAPARAQLWYRKVQGWCGGVR